MTNMFDILIERYDAWYDSEEGVPLYKSEFACLRPLVEEAPRPILEIGVGTGRFAMYFLPATGVDPTLTTLKLARARGINTVQSVGEKLPFDDGSFGCVLIIVTLCFAEDPLRVLLEAKRVLKRNGRIVIGFVTADSPWGDYDQEKKKEGHLFYGIARCYTFAGIEKLLKESGLAVTKVRSTLIRRPDQQREIEEPVDGYVTGAGFICIAAEKARIE